MKAKAFAHKVFSYGPGGWKCQCCGPSRRYRQRERRRLRRIEERLINKIEAQELEDGFDVIRLSKISLGNWLAERGTLYDLMMKKRNENEA
jgi:hypothetical protein